MQYPLTSSQRNFYNKNFTLDSQIWNQGVMEIFPKVYSYEQINTAYNKLVEAHDSLRVKLVETEDGVVADVKEHEHINYRFWQVETEEELMKKAQDFLNEPIDRYGLLVNCAVFQTPTTSGVMINAHHIVVDGYSVIVMAEHINNFLKDENFTPVIQKYPDYVAQEEKYKQSRRYGKSQEFWLKQFSGDPHRQIFTPAEDIFDFTSSEINRAIPNELFGKIKSLCDENEISPASFFNAVNAVYINRKYDLENFTLGVPIFNRTTPDELNTIGLYMHLVPLVINVKNDSFIDNAKRIEDSQMNLFRHQSFTQQDIKALLNENNILANQLFDIVSDYQEFSRNEDFQVKVPYGNALSVPIEMHLQSFDEGNYNLKIRYRTAYFNENEVQTMMNSILAIAEDAVLNPDKNICKLEMISYEEKQKILTEFNDTQYTFNAPEGSTLYSLFEVEAEKNRDKVCIRANDEGITFGEFKAYAERLDSKVREYTKGEKSVVAVICERGFEMYGAIYGIIRGGNAYLPIDPNYPQDRINYILENSNAKAVITQDKFYNLAGKTPCINATEVLKDNTETEKTEILATPEDTAYVIYTSGSTGNPKGAKVSHKSAVNRILWMHDFYPLEENDVILQKTPYTFDVSVWEHFWWGIIGGSLAVSKPDEHFLPAKILCETEKNSVTHLHFVPSVFDIFLTYLENNPEEQSKFNTAKYVFLSGEALTANHINRFYNIYDYNEVQLHNLYGPTECAVDVSYYPCVPNDMDPVPIGKPVYNTQLHIVDKHLNATPVGVIGELCIAGIQVGQGYLNNETLTNEKFIDNPFGSGKLYKTGDLAYWRNDGQIIYCGRMDNQIKLNGQRVELGEIETAIGQVKGIESVAVLIKQNNGKDVLVAFCSGNASVEDITEYCEQKLPQYMVPSKIEFIEKMPLNASGKLDRKALKNIEVIFDNNEVKEMAANELERTICEIFQKALKIDNVGRNESFFTLGGTSIDMISVLSEESFKDVSPAQFIANPTPEKLANVMSDGQKIAYENVDVLKNVPNSEKMLILIPYAGGDATAYARFVEEFSHKNSDMSVCFVKYLRSYEECEKVAETLAQISKTQKLYIYSHCAGAAVALQIINILEEMEIPIVCYAAGGFIPPKMLPKKNIWNMVPANYIRKRLVSAGAPFESFTDKQNNDMIDRFRKDTDFMTEYFYKNAKKIKVPTSVIISKNDSFTKNYKQTRPLWDKHCEDLRNIYLIEANTHYFQSDNSDDLVRIILEEFGKA